MVCPVEAWTATFSHDGRQIAAGTHAGNVNIWTVETGSKDQTLETRGKFVMSVAYVSIEEVALKIDRQFDARFVPPVTKWRVSCLWSGERGDIHI